MPGVEWLAGVGIPGGGVILGGLYWFLRRLWANGDISGAQASNSSSPSPQTMRMEAIKEDVGDLSETMNKNTDRIVQAIEKGNTAIISLAQKSAVEHAVINTKLDGIGGD